MTGTKSSLDIQDHGAGFSDSDPLDRGGQALFLVLLLHGPNKRDGIIHNVIKKSEAFIRTTGMAT